jgi:diguanylate cyclase (GGDEF)-like protein
MAASTALPRRRIGLAKPPTGALKIWLLSAVLGATAVLLYAIGVTGRSTPLAPTLSIPWWLLAVGFYLAETNVVHLEFRRQAHTFSLSEIPFVLGLVFASPTEFVLASVLGSAIGLVVRRQPLIKLSFNVSHFALEAVVAVVLFDRLNGHAPDPGAQLWLAAFITTAAVNAVGILSVSFAIGFAEGRWQRERLAEVLRFGLAVGMTNTSLALMAVTILWLEPAAAWLLGIPIVLMLLAYRTLMSEREKNKSLELLYETTRILQRSPELGAVVADLLAHARTMFRAGTARLVLFPNRPGEMALETIIDSSEERRVMSEIDFDPLDGLLRRALAENGGFLYERPDDYEFDPIQVGHPDLRDAMVTALRGEKGVIGLLVISDRLGDVTSFVPEDLKLFETLANHAAMALENGQLGRSLVQLAELKDQLRHQAYHDVLTGLGNRALFLERLGEALDREMSGRGDPPAILFVDLDDFKTINDSLGHPAGDELLKLVANRLKASIRPQDLAARLGGDEFAVLVGGVSPDDESVTANSVAARAVLIAERILDALREPFMIAGTGATIRGSIGVAVSRQPLEGAEALVRDADVAMYEAKNNGKGGFAIFHPQLYTAVVRRHSMKGELQSAVDGHSFILQYQPIRELRTGRTISMEALIRWRHPVRGTVSPTEFIPFAEETGLILPIGRWVMERAIQEARRWQVAAGADAPSVSVNVSATQLQQPTFVEDLAVLLEAQKFQPSRLTIEITETLMMQDVETMVARLAAVRSLGVRIALDDFGTGWSSMAWLREFPVDALKIPRELIGGLGSSESDWEFARAIVTLGHAMRLNVVAEGIEFADQVHRLHGIGVDAGQGYFFSPPVGARKALQLVREGGAGSTAAVPPMAPPTDINFVRGRNADRPALRRDAVGDRRVVGLHPGSDLPN